VRCPPWGEIKLADYVGKKPVVLFFYVYAFSNA